MKKYYLKVVSKNEKSLTKILYFLSKHLKTKFNILQKTIISHNDRKIITLLKSPHVNKTAQEHFEVRTFSSKILFSSDCLEKDLIFLKKILFELFQDVSIRLELLIHDVMNKKEKQLLLYPSNFILWTNNLAQTNFKRCRQKTFLKRLSIEKQQFFNTIKLLNLISVFGEIYIRNFR